MPERTRDGCRINLSHCISRQRERVGQTLLVTRLVKMQDCARWTVYRLRTAGMFSANRRVSAIYCPQS